MPVVRVKQPPMAAVSFPVLMCVLPGVKARLPGEIIDHGTSLQKTWSDGTRRVFQELPELVG
ncbi:MAG TPA: hypothetical protein DIT03_16605 [Candidatus Accumulibacter sp.]|nr:hypothetical protein [Accumulibacter sp.]